MPVPHDDDAPKGGCGPEEVPADLMRRAREAFSQKAPGELASLVSDSLIDEGDPAGAHRLVFEGASVKIELDLSAGQARTVIKGRITGASAERAFLHLEGSELALAPTGDRDSFAFQPLAHGLVRLSVESAAGPDVWTDWFQI